MAAAAAARTFFSSQIQSCYNCIKMCCTVYQNRNSEVNDEKKRNTVILFSALPVCIGM